MIKNERQYKISKAAARKFQAALTEPLQDVGVDIDPMIAEATREALASQLHDLESELFDYESLKSGDLQIVSVDSFDELPVMLIRGRIAAGMTQKELADRLDVKPQQIQRYEESEYRHASFSRLIEIADAVNLNVRHEGLVGATVQTADQVLDRLTGAGLPQRFIEHRLALSDVTRAENPGMWVAALLDRTQRIFGWDPSVVLRADVTLDLDSQPAHAARFKIAKRRNEQRVTAYTVYAHYLATTLIEQLPEVDPVSLPSTAENFYDTVAIKYGKVNLENALRLMWSLGIAVIPLQDEGSFDGAYWRIANRHVIVLKPNTDSSARWLFDALHDYCHATQHPQEADNSIIELPPTDTARIEDPDEVEANDFASDVIVAGQGEQIWNAAAEKTQGLLPRLKNVLPHVAAELGIDLGAAAYYMAHRIMLYGDNWWGAAANLQPLGEQPWLIARDVMLEHIHLHELAPPDRRLLQAALTD